MWVVASWSGGKDGDLACYKAILGGFEVSHLLNLVFKEVEGRRPHGLVPELIAIQAEAMEIPIVQREVTWDTYEEECKSAIRDLKRTAIGGGVFGEICIQPHREWVHRVCGELGEYYTFVTDGPLFKRCLKVLKYQKVLISGLDGKKYRFLDISGVEGIEKERNIR